MAGRKKAKVKKKPVKRKPGRPLKFSAAVQSKIVAFILGGNYLEAAAAAAGVCKATVYDWLKRGAPGNEKKDPKGKFREFSDAVEKASGAAEVVAVGQIAQAGENSWQARAWWLERRFPARWGRVEYREEGKDEIRRRTTEDVAKEFDELVRRAEKRLKKPVDEPESA